MTVPTRDSSIVLSDGRKLAYAEWGEASGAPVIYFHGLPGSRFECWGGATAYAGVGARLITVDRPGIGGSAPQPGRFVSDWPNDVVALADVLGLERFTILAHSAGTPYALACAQRLAARLDAVGLMGAVPRLDQPWGLEEIGSARYWRLAKERPPLMHLNYSALVAVFRVLPRLGEWILLRDASACDRAALVGEDARGRLRASVLKGAQPGSGGLVEDMRVLMRPWGSDPADITARVLLWHGKNDAYVDVSVPERYASAIPNGTLNLVPDQGHFSLAERYAGEIVNSLLAAGGRPTRIRESRDLL
jgi:pimeloyl-ACP methyl ester carboxylesterase